MPKNPLKEHWIGGCHQPGLTPFLSMKHSQFAYSSANSPTDMAPIYRSLAELALIVPPENRNMMTSLIAQIGSIESTLSTAHRDLTEAAKVMDTLKMAIEKIEGQVEEAINPKKEEPKAGMS